MITGCQPEAQPGSSKNCFSDLREHVEALIALPLILLGLAWLQELVDQVIFGGRWNLALGPGTPWWSLFTAPFSHQGFAHLITNSLVFLPLSYLVLARSQKVY